MAETAAECSVEFSLSAWVREYVYTSEDMDPSSLAKTIVVELPDVHLREALLQALPGLIGDIQRAYGFWARRQAQSDATGSRRPSVPGPSKWVGVGDVVRAALAAPYTVGAIRKRLGDCTRADVLAMAASRGQIAEATARESRRFELFAEAMREAKAATVADLPEPKILEVLRWHP